MARSRYCKACQGWHNLEQAWPAECAGHFGQVNAAPMIRTDGMDPVKSMADGRVYDSRSAYYRSVKNAGCEIVGDDRAGFGKRPEFTPHAGVERDIKRTIEQLRSR
jgi:hypothetical protein